MKTLIQNSLLALLFIFIALAAFLPGLLPPSEIREVLLIFGEFTPLIFIAIYAARGLFLFLPAGLLSVAGGLMFGAIWGTLYILIGATLSALFTFFLSKKLAGNPPAKIFGFSLANIENWREKLTNNGFRFIFLLRLIPLFHFDLISIGAGVARIPLKKFLWGTILGIMPFTLLNASLGEALIQSSQTTVLLLFSAIFLLSALPFFFPGFGKMLLKYL